MSTPEDRSGRFVEGIITGIMIGSAICLLGGSQILSLQQEEAGEQIRIANEQVSELSAQLEERDKAPVQTAAQVKEDEARWKKESDMEQAADESEWAINQILDGANLGTLNGERNLRIVASPEVSIFGRFNEGQEKEIVKNLSKAKILKGSQVEIYAYNDGRNPSYCVHYTYGSDPYGNERTYTILSADAYARESFDGVPMTSSGFDCSIYRKR